MAGSESDDKPKPSQAAVSETTAANQQHDAAPHNTEQTAEPTDSKRTKSIPQDDSAKSVPSSPESDDAGHPPTKHDREEAISRKRDREGSVEPSSTAAASARHIAPRSSDALPAKKNRIIDTSDDEPADHKAKTGTDSERGKVGQIRRRVEELSYEERESKRAVTDAKRSSDESARSTDKQQQQIPQPSISTPPSTTSETVSQAAATPTPARKQPTFSSFSSSSSPFASSSASAGVSGPSWLAGSSSSANGTARSGGISGSTGAIKPSALGGDDSKPSEPSSSSSSSTTTTKPTSSESVPKSAPASSAPKSSAGLGFGAFAGSRPFTKSSGTPQAADTPSPAASTPKSSGNGDEPSTDSPKAPSTLSSLAASSAGKDSVFDRALKEESASAVGTPSSQVAEPGTPATEVPSEEAGKVKVHKKADAELATGEEEERTVHSVRAKLYAIMKGEGENATSAADGQWKERGTGTVRVNIPKTQYHTARDSSGARLVMRAEGVLRLILNVALFSGMKVELAQDKFVRLVALEDGKLVHLALRVSNPAAAHALYNAIRSRIPQAQKKKKEEEAGEGKDVAGEIA